MSFKLKSVDTQLAERLALLRSQQVARREYLRSIEKLVEKHDLEIRNLEAQLEGVRHG